MSAQDASPTPAPAGADAAEAEAAAASPGSQSGEAVEAMRASMRRDLEMRVLGRLFDAHRREGGGCVQRLTSQAEAKMWASAKSLDEYRAKIAELVSNHATALHTTLRHAPDHIPRRQLTTRTARTPPFVATLADGPDDAD